MMLLVVGEELSVRGMSRRNDGTGKQTGISPQVIRLYGVLGGLF